MVNAEGSVRLGRAVQEAGDYFEDGLLHCGKCKTKKEKAIQGFLGRGSVIVSCVCECRKKEMQDEEKRRLHEEEMRKINAIKASSLMENKLKSASLATFEVTADNEKLFRLASRYVNHFEELCEKSQGILFFGNVGTGKSFTAACIANELMNKQVTVMMTSFVKILQDIQGFQVNEKDYIFRLNSAKLLIIDDLGTERSTEYAMEKIYNIIDSRYRSGRPLILTTNMTLKEMQQTTDIRCKRIYDRIFEMCFPFHCVGRSRREKEAAKRFDEMKKMLEE